MAQLPGDWPIKKNPLREGATFRRVLTFTNKLTGIPINLSDAIVSMRIRQKGTPNALELSAGRGIEITNAVNGEVMINLLIPIGTFAFKEGSVVLAKHQLDVAIAGLVTPYLHGDVLILKKL